MLSSASAHAAYLWRQRIAAEINAIENCEMTVGMLDITLYRDDLSTLGYNPVVHGTDINFDLSGKHVVLVDDVLYTGRTIRAALTPLSTWAGLKQFSLPCW